MTTSLTPWTKSKNKKQKASTAISDIPNQYFRKLFKKCKNLPYLGYKKKQVHNEPTESYFFPIKDILKLVKIKKYVPLSTKRDKLDVNGTKHVNIKK